MRNSHSVSGQTHPPFKAPLYSRWAITPGGAKLCTGRRLAHAARMTLALLACVISGAFPRHADAGKFNKVLTPGDAAPEFSNLPGIDDERHSLADYRKAPWLVIVFLSHACPMSRGYDEPLVAIQDAYRERGVTMLAINVGLAINEGLAEEGLAVLKTRAEEAGYTFPYLIDEKRDTARAYGVLHTPTVFVLDEERKVRYQGAIDDRKVAASPAGESAVGEGVSGKTDRKSALPQRAWLTEALDALLADREPSPTETRARGCAVHYD